MPNTFFFLVPDKIEFKDSVKGALPLSLPRQIKTSCHVSIVYQVGKVTVYWINRADFSAGVFCMINTWNEWILSTGVNLLIEQSGKEQVRAGSMYVSCTVAAQIDNPDPQQRIFVDHANGFTLDDTAANLQWVMPSFNSFNVQKELGKDEYHGVISRTSKKSHEVNVARTYQGAYKKKLTAAKVHNIAARLIFEDQLEKCPKLLNNLEDTPTKPFMTLMDGPTIWMVDGIYITFYEGKYHGQHKKLDKALAKARVLVETLQREQAVKEAEWARIAAELIVKVNKDGVACFYADSMVK